MLAVVLAASLSFAPFSVGADDGDEVALFDRRAQAIAYVSPKVDDESTIYLWSGKPVAYLKRYSRRNTVGFDVWGFNGTHLGWFESGVVYDHNGKVECAAKESFKTPTPEPLVEPSVKPFKQATPIKEFRKGKPSFPGPPFPGFTTFWGDASCNSFLAGGATRGDL